MSEIMACPCCGSASGVHAAGYSYFAACNSCTLFGPAEKTEADAVNAWNRLALAVQIADAGKRCEEELDGSRGPGNFRQELRRLLEQWEVDDEDDLDA